MTHKDLDARLKIEAKVAYWVAVIAILASFTQLIIR